MYINTLYIAYCTYVDWTTLTSLALLKFILIKIFEHKQYSSEYYNIIQTCGCNVLSAMFAPIVDCTQWAPGLIAGAVSRPFNICELSKV